MPTDRRRVSKFNPRKVAVNRYSKAWQTERANRLHRLFKRVEIARQRGKSVKEALRPFSRYWTGKRYRTNPEVQVRFSPTGLRRRFYQWRRGGRTPEAVALHYHAAAKPTPRHRARFLRAVQMPGVVTMAAAFGQATGIPFTWPAFCRALPSGIRATVSHLLRARRRQRTIESRFKRFLGERKWV